MFEFFKPKEIPKTKDMQTFVCKHCKLSCKDCESIYCFTCYMNPKNPCPRCGKTANDPKEK